MADMVAFVACCVVSPVLAALCCDICDIVVITYTSFHTQKLYVAAMTSILDWA